MNPQNRLSRTLYMLAHPACAICALRGKTTLGTDPHHVIGRGFVGMDDGRALLSVCRSCHDSVQGTQSGRVVSLYAKLKLGELDLPWLEEKSGKRIGGLISNYVSKLDKNSPIKAMGEAILEEQK